MVYSRKCVSLNVALLAAVLWLLGVHVARGVETVFRLPQGQDVVFCNYFGTGVVYFLFRRDGTYCREVHSDLGSSVPDHGTWRQNEEGVIEYRSKERVKGVQCGPLSIPVGCPAVMEAMASLQGDIAAFLARTNSMSFSREEIEDAWQYTYAPFPGVSKLTFTSAAVLVSPEVNQISRTDIENLLDEWSRYMANDEKNLFHAIPIIYQGGTYLTSPDALTGCANVAKLKESLDRWTHESSNPLFVYSLMPYEQYLDQHNRLSLYFSNDLTQPTSSVQVHARRKKVRYPGCSGPARLYNRRNSLVSQPWLRRGGIKGAFHVRW